MVLRQHLRCLLRRGRTVASGHVRALLLLPAAPLCRGRNTHMSLSATLPESCACLPLREGLQGFVPPDGNAYARLARRGVQSSDRGARVVTGRHGTCPQPPDLARELI